MITKIEKGTRFIGGWKGSGLSGLLVPTHASSINRNIPENIVSLKSIMKYAGQC